MSLKKLLWLGALVSGFILPGCSVLQPEALTSCTADEFCADDSLCHPLAKVCVKRCESDSDCPENAKACSGVSTASGSERKFCQCQNTEQCGGEEDIICGEEEKVCAPKCTSDVDCTFGRQCEVSTGNCRAT